MKTKTVYVVQIKDHKDIWHDAGESIDPEKTQKLIEQCKGWTKLIKRTETDEVVYE